MSPWHAFEKPLREMQERAEKAEARVAEIEAGSMSAAGRVERLALRVGELEGLLYAALPHTTGSLRAAIREELGELPEGPMASVSTGPASEGVAPLGGERTSGPPLSLADRGSEESALSLGAGDHPVAHAGPRGSPEHAATPDAKLEPAREPKEAGATSVQVDADAWRWAVQKTKEQRTSEAGKRNPGYGATKEELDHIFSGLDARAAQRTTKAEEPFRMGCLGCDSGEPAVWCMACSQAERQRADNPEPNNDSQDYRRGYADGLRATAHLLEGK